MSWVLGHVASLISTTTQPSSAACSRSPGFGHRSTVLSIFFSHRRSLQGISSRQFAHSAHRACPPAGTTRIAAIARVASPHRRQIRSSPSHRASNPTSAIVAGSSISSTRMRLSSVSKASSSTNGWSAINSDARPLPHSSNRTVWRPAPRSGVPAGSRTFRARVAPDAPSPGAARRPPGWRCPCG